MRFTLAIYSAPSQPGALCGFRFAETLLSQGHEVSQIFFYQDGVLNGCNNNKFNTTLNNTSFYTTSFPQFARLNIPLLVCSTALSQRNIAENQLIDGFKIASLTQFFADLLKSDRYIVF